MLAWKTEHVTRSEPCWPGMLSMLQEVRLAEPEDSVCFKKCCWPGRLSMLQEVSLAGLEDSVCYKK